MAEGGRWGPGPGQDQACRDLGYSRGVPAQAWRRGWFLGQDPESLEMAALPTVGLEVELSTMPASPLRQVHILGGCLDRFEPDMR